MKKISIIGSGFAGLSSAACLAKEGFAVTVFEKNESPGGRARKFEAQGFVFDMGPSWYWMPEVFETYFNRFEKTTGDFYDLQRLDPSYRIYYGKDDYLDVPAGIEALCELFERLETGSGKYLRQFLVEAHHKYSLGVERMAYKPGLSARELMNANIIRAMFKLQIFQSLSKHVRRFFSNPRIIQMLEFPVLFLGASPERTPALYSLMNYADMALGTWYPPGGMFRVVEAMMSIAVQQGVQFKFNAPVTKIALHGKRVSGIQSDNEFFPSDYVVAGADYHHVEQELLPQQHRQYGDRYWNSRVMAPSSLIFYMGIGKKLNTLRHHTLFFDTDFSRHSREIYDVPQWPAAPQFYVSCTSRSDPTTAPQGHENVFVLVPVAPGLEDRSYVREKYFQMILERLEAITGESLRDHIVYKRSYAHNDFIRDYNAFKGNAYGLANTLRQTANLKPSIQSYKATNLFYTGQLTVPGPGVPPAIISGQVAAQALIRQHRKDMQTNL